MGWGVLGRPTLAPRAGLPVASHPPNSPIPCRSARLLAPRRRTNDDDRRGPETRGSPVCSVLVERLGCRATVMLGGVLSGLGMAASSFTRSIGQLYVTAGVVTGLGFCLSFQPAVTILGQYFVRRRAFANAVSSTGTALGLCTLPALANFLHGELGWRGSFLVLGAVLLNCCVCGAVMRPLEREPTKPAPVGRQPSSGSGCVGTSRISACVSKHMALDQLQRNRRYRVYAVAITWTMLGFVVPLIYLVPYATANGMEAGRAASLLSVLGVVNMAVRPPVGAVFSLPWFRGRHVYVFSAALLLNGLSNAVCCLGPAFPVLLAYVLLYGLSMSVVGSLMYTVLMDVVDMSRFASALGLLSVMESVTLLVGPPLAGILVDSTGQYFYVFLACSAVVSSAAVFLATAFWWMDASERATGSAGQEDGCQSNDELLVESLVVCRPPGGALTSTKQADLC
ncbi:monocarboxylate transporter 6-like isoform X2 [Vanacampus margaritifer]